MRRGQLGNILKERVGRRHISVAQVKGQDATAHLRFYRGIGQDRFDLGAEDNPVLVPIIVERFLPNPVSRQE